VNAKALFARKTTDPAISVGSPIGFDKAKAIAASILCDRAAIKAMCPLVSNRLIPFLSLYSALLFFKIAVAGKFMPLL
jgi:hypothetical protein